MNKVSGSLHDALLDAVRGHDADHVEVRVDESESTQLSYRGRRLEEVGRSSGRGGCVRALVNGGWAFATFNDVEDLRTKAEAVVKQARMTAHERSYFAHVDPVTDVVEAGRSGRSHRAVPLNTKKELLDRYNGI
ncbi:MAG: TldD/PmbA family protein, partial [Chloroflexi bacterium]|nr:TldD/PmbA family protein [Chloroflexota bacterium]